MDDNQAQRPIAVFTGSRAEYGLLRHLITAIAAEPGLSLQLIVSGTHLSTGHGGTIAEIEADGHNAAALVPLSIDYENPASMAALCAEALQGVAQALERLQPELLILLGDRYEAFAAASASHLMGVPVVHLHGGETTEGAVDDRLRHAISQLSTWHFTAAETYRCRIMAMGHPHENVFNIGPMAIDGILTTPPSSRKEFERSTGFQFGSRNLLVTYHPETLLADRGISGFKALLKALEYTDCHVLFTYPNADSGSDQLLTLLRTFVNSNPGRSWALPSLGQKRYLQALQLFEAVAGNSSSGVIEAPLIGMPALNIGNRQSGRLRFGHVCEAKGNQDEIHKGLKYVLEAGSNRRAAQQRWPKKDTSPTERIMKWLRSLK